MKFRPRKFVCSLLVILLATLMGHAANVTAAEQLVVIDIRGSKFVQDNVIVRPGDTVIWRNKDIVPHTATARDASWDSGLIPAGGEWQMVVSDETSPSYYCAFHPSMVAVLAISSK